jgi:hypothetical protein
MYIYIYISERKKVTRNLRKLHNEKAQDLYSSPHMIWVGRVCGMYEENNIFYRYWWEHLRERDHLDELGLVIGTDIKEIGWEDLNWIYVAQDREKGQALVNTVINLLGS